MGAIGQNRATAGPASPNHPGCEPGPGYSGNCPAVAATNRHRQQMAVALCAPGIDRVARWSPFGATTTLWRPGGASDPRAAGSTPTLGLCHLERLVGG